MDIENVKAADIMTHSVATVRDTADVREALSLFKELGISGAPVVDEDGNLAGVLSQTDVVNYYLSRDDELTSPTDFYHRAHLGALEWREGYEVMDTNVARVSEIMSPTTFVAFEDTSVRDLAKMMTQKQIHRIIITRSDRVVGLVSALDILKLFT